MRLVYKLHKLVLNGEADLPHAHSEAREVSQVVLSAFQEAFKLGEGEVGRIHWPRAKNARDASLAGRPKRGRGMYAAKSVRARAGILDRPFWTEYAIPAVR